MGEQFGYFLKSNVYPSSSGINELGEMRVAFKGGKNI